MNYLIRDSRIRAAGARGLYAFVLCAGLAACATPTEVKALSAAQVGYIDAAALAVQNQTEALLAACEIIRQDAEARIAAELANVRVTASNGLAAAIPATMEASRADIAGRFIDRTTSAAQAAAQSRAQLQANLAEIRTRTQALQNYLAELKNAQRALDAYLQSEQFGERVTREVLGTPGAQAVIGKVSALLGAMSTQGAQLTTLVNGLKTTGATP